MSATIEKLVSVYVKIRDKRSELKRTFEAEDEVLKSQLELIERELLARSNESGVKSFRTDMGTAYIEETTKASTADWAAFTRFVRDNDAFDMIERRVKVKELKDYMDSHDGALPPGVNVFRESVVRVRRA